MINLDVLFSTDTQFSKKSTGNHPATGARCFDAQLIILDHPGKIFVGYTPVLDCHTAHVACRIVKLKQKLDRKTGEVIEENPVFVVKNDVCLVTFEPTKPLCVETFAEFPPLGRFAVRDMKSTVAVGVIKEVDHEERVAEHQHGKEKVTRMEHTVSHVKSGDDSKKKGTKTVQPAHGKKHHALAQ